MISPAWILYGRMTVGLAIPWLRIDPLWWLQPTLTCWMMCSPLINFQIYVLWCGLGLTIPLRKLMKIWFASCWVKFIVCPRSKTSFRCSLKHFNSMHLMSINYSLSSSDASMISNNSFFIASKLFLIISKGSLRLLGFLHCPAHHSHPNKDVEGTHLMNFYYYSFFFYLL